MLPGEVAVIGLLPKVVSSLSYKNIMFALLITLTILMLTGNWGEVGGRWLWSIPSDVWLLHGLLSLLGLGLAHGIAWSIPCHLPSVCLYFAKGSRTFEIGWFFNLIPIKLNFFFLNWVVEKKHMIGRRQPQQTLRENVK